MLLALDHVSLRADPGAITALGLHVTPTSPDHARVLLDRGYLELRPGAGPPAGLGWFLRPDALAAARTRLSAAGLGVQGPAPYAGVDGQWHDLIPAGPTPITPILTRRVDRDDWPPALTAPHPGGATALAGVDLGARDPGALLALLAALGAQVSEDRARVGAAEITVHGADRDALWAVSLGPDGPRIALAPH